jgi:hypothetical protein
MGSLAGSASDASIPEGQLNHDVGDEGEPPYVSADVQAGAVGEKRRCWRRHERNDGGPLRRRRGVPSGKVRSGGRARPPHSDRSSCCLRSARCDGAKRPGEAKRRAHGALAVGHTARWPKEAGGSAEQVASRPSLRRRSRSSEGARDSPSARWMTEGACRTRVPSRSVSQRASRAPSGGTTHTPRRHPQRVPCQCHSPSIHTDSGRGRGGTTSARIAGGGNGTSTNSSGVWGDVGSDGSDEPQPQSNTETMDTWRSMGQLSA